MKTQFGIAKINGKEITIGGNREVICAIRKLSEFGLITFSRQIKFKSTEYTVCFFKVCSLNIMNFFGVFCNVSMFILD